MRGFILISACVKSKIWKTTAEGLIWFDFGALFDFLHRLVQDVAHALLALKLFGRNLAEQLVHSQLIQVGFDLKADVWKNLRCCLLFLVG